MDDKTFNRDTPPSDTPSARGNGEKGDRKLPAGPHAKPELTDEERTPGAGTLPDTGADEVGDGASS